MTPDQFSELEKFLKFLSAAQKLGEDNNKLAKARYAEECRANKAESERDEIRADLNLLFAAFESVARHLGIDTVAMLEDPSVVVRAKAVDAR